MKKIVLISPNHTVSSCKLVPSEHDAIITNAEQYRLLADGSLKDKTVLVDVGSLSKEMTYLEMCSAAHYGTDNMDSWPDHITYVTQKPFMVRTAVSSGAGGFIPFIGFHGIPTTALRFLTECYIAGANGKLYQYEPVTSDAQPTHKIFDSKECMRLWGIETMLEEYVSNQFSKV